MTPAVARAMYRRQMQAHGELITLRRIVPNAPAIEAQALGKVTGYAPDELVGGINQGDQKVVLLAEDLELGDLPLPPKASDKIVYLDRVLNVQFQPTQRRVAGVAIAYDLVVRG